jgi:hypothetical protein
MGAMWEWRQKLGDLRQLHSTAFDCTQRRWTVKTQSTAHELRCISGFFNVDRAELRRAFKPRLFCSDNSPYKYR